MPEENISCFQCTLRSAVFFDKMAAEWRAEQARCQREIERHQEKADKSYMDEGVHFNLRGMPNGCSSGRNPRQKRRLLNFVLSNCTWEDGEVVATFPRNHLIFWQKRLQSPSGQRPLKSPI